MFDIGFPELLIVSIVALLVLGPERLPEALRTLGLWFGRMRRSFSAVKVEIEREIGMDEVRRQLHNEAILEEMRELESQVGTIGNDLEAQATESLEADEIVNEPHPDDLASDLPDATENIRPEDSDQSQKPAG